MHFGRDLAGMFDWLQDENTETKGDGKQQQKSNKSDEVEMSRDAEGDTSKMDQY